MATRDGAKRGAQERVPRARDTFMYHRLTTQRDGRKTVSNRPNNHTRLRSWWMDDPADPGRLTLNDAGVQNLLAELCPHSQVTDLGSELLDAYEQCAPSRLSATQRRALVPYMATVPLYAAVLDGFTEASAAKLRSRLPALKLSRWLLANADAITARLVNER